MSDTTWDVCEKLLCIKGISEGSTRLCAEHLRLESAKRLVRKHSTTFLFVHSFVDTLLQLTHSDRDRKHYDNIENEKKTLDKRVEGRKNHYFVRGGTVRGGKVIQLASWDKGVMKGEFQPLTIAMINAFFHVMQLNNPSLLKKIRDSIGKNQIWVDLWYNVMFKGSYVKKHSDLMPNMKSGTKGVSCVYCAKGDTECKTILYDPRTDLVIAEITLKAGEFMVFDGVYMLHETTKVKADEGRQVLAMVFYFNNNAE